MRRRDLTATLAVLALLGAGSARADVVVLKDGRTITTVGPPVLKGRTALLKTPDGQLFSISADEIDAAKTEAARLKPTPAPSPAPTPLRPARPAEIAGKTPARKATVVLTDEEVAAGVPYAGENEKKPDEGEPLVEVSNATSLKTPEGYSISGSVTNVGKSEAAGVSVTIEAVGAEDKTISSVFGELSKDRLAPGEKSTFRARMAKPPEDPRLFRYLPRWQVRVPVRSAAAAGEGSGSPSPPPPPPTGSSEDEAKRAEIIRGGPPEASPTPKVIRVPQPDVAAPPANAPIGAPDKPGGTFLPKPTGDQPKPPSGG